MLLCRHFYNSVQHFQKQFKTKDLDPIQRLFLEKINEYTVNKQKSGKALLDVSPELEKRLNDTLSKLQSNYSQSLKDKDLNKFPEFRFEEPKLELIDIKTNE